MTRALGRVFVTGADGFIGSHLVEELIATGHDVTALCVYNSMGTHGWLQNYAAKPPANLRLVLGDVRDADQMQKYIAGCQTVFHLASLIAIPYSYVAPQSYFDTNVNGAMNVAQACLRHGVERLVNTSTSEVYGTAQTVPINESHPIQAQSPYSASKIAADALVESFRRSFDLPVVTLRPFNTYGPRQSLRAVIPSIICQGLFGTGHIELGNTTPTRDFNYVSDTVSAFIAVASAPDERVIGQVLNAGSGREISIADTVTLVSKLLEVDLRVSTDTLRIRPEKSEVERLLCDHRKLMEATSWQPRVSLEQGILETIKWTRENVASTQTGSYRV